jgi:uncharacterized repeat protein (TIGR01451 family)
MSARETKVRKDSRLFAEMCAALMDRGHKVQFRAQGSSMLPNILDGDELVVAPATQAELRAGDVTLIQNADGLRVHRVTPQSTPSGSVITRSDTGQQVDPPASRLFGKVTLQRRHNTEVAFSPLQTRVIHPAQVLLRRARIAAALRLRRAGLFLFGIASLIFLAVTMATPSAFAQADLTMTQTASVTAVATGTNYNYTETVTNNGPTTIPTGTLVVYQQTPPNTTYQAVAGGANWRCRNGAGNALAANYQGPIVCTYQTTLASGVSAPTITLTEAINAGTAAGTTIQNSATVTSQLTDPVPTNNTTVTSILVEPAASSDLSVSMTVAPTPVFISSNLTYTIVVTNLGQATVPATANILKDVLPAGVTFVSATPPAGWTCSGTTTVQCSLTGTMAMNATATFTITVTAPASASTLSNTAQTTLAGDPNANNNSATIVTVVQPLICATPGRDGAGGTITGVVNTYFAPAAGTLAAGATSVVIGAGTGATTPIAAGDLLLFIQMQDASINSTNTGAYGDGTPGDPATGSSALASSGVFEFVTATNAVVIGGGTLQFTGTGTGGGLLNSYAKGAATGTQGQQTYQVIRVPQYTSATLSNGLVPLTWNGSVGGVLAIDVSAQLTLGGTVTLDALGFRGGGGRILAGTGTGANTDYVTLSTNLANSSKGEGIAGTPMYVAPGTITLTTTATNTGAEGLPAGSYARGAPGNAGGGGTDGDPVGNSENSGGGGGGNGGTGGLGGYGWNSFTALNSTDGGFGGATFPATTSALVMGGGGGAGTTNDGSYYTSSGSHNADCGANCTGIYSSGGAGGGIAIIHAGSVTGTGTISANGRSTLSTDNDSTGGGGAGGSIEVFANSGGLTGLTISAAGGSAGNAWPETAPGTFSGARHGPGGGGAGGVAILTGAPTAINVAGGNNGYTNTAQDSYGATPGQAGISSIVHIITETPGTQSGAYCAGADLSVTNSGLPAVVAPGGAITYTQTVTNNGPLDAVNAVFSEAIPANTTFASITTPAGWTCTTPAVGATGNISCTNPNVLSLATSTFTVVVNVAAGTINGTQIADVDNITSGTSDPNLANNSATALTTVSLATGADLITTMTSSSPTTLAGTTVTMTAVVKNQGPGAAGASNFSEPLDLNTTFASMVIPAGWTCSLPAVGTNGTIYCSATTIAVGASSTFAAVLNVPATVASGTTITETGTASSATPDPNPSNNAASATTVVATAGQADLAVTSTATPTLISPGNNITYTQTVTNNGPATVTNGTVTSVTFTDTIPTNTTLAQAFVQPAGWTCASPAVGATGTVSCTLNAGQTIVKGGTVNFPLVVKVNAGPVPAPPPAGTIISNTANINNAPCSATQDPNCANNSSTTTVTVALPSQADVSIVKTASPEPVNQGTNLTYTLKVTNAGPAVAQGVAVSDPLPAQVTYASSSTSQGTCTYTAATTTVACTIGTLSVGSVAIVTINVTANTFSSGTLSSNTATVTATTSDPNLANNTSTFVSTIQSPTAVDLASFRVFTQNDGTALLEWRTHEESRNLGFHLYREDATGRHRVDPSIVAGSALLLRGSKPQHAAKLYRWIDSQPTPNATYWIEDLDINGTRTMHGPYYAEPSGSAPSLSPSTQTVASAPIQRAQVLSQLQASATASAAVIPLRNTMRPIGPRPVLPIYPVNYPRFTVADHVAVKISVEQEGWYHVTFAQLYAAGLDSNIDTRSLHLYAEGVEQPMLITRPSGPVSPTDAIEFYGSGIDTPYSGTRVYWLVRENTYPRRINTIPAPMGGSAAPTSFAFSSVREDRTGYFAALLNGENNDNFFGAIVTSDPVGQDLLVTHIDPSSAIPTTLDITLQGVTDQQEHTVNVQLNGSMLGQMTFQNQSLYSQSFPVDVSLLQSGTNTVTLTSMNGDNDVSLVQSIVLQYPHTYAADNNWLKATAPAGTQLTITGFSNPQIRVFDITDTLNITELSGTVSPASGVYDVVVKLPHGAASPRTILAFSSDTESAPVALRQYTPTFLDDHRSNADYVVVAYPDFVPSLTPLLQLREAQGHRVSVVTTDQIYDEYNFGERSPFAIRSYLQDAATKGQRKPQSILFVGDASLDPRNYLGFGQTDFVPTRMIETAAFKTASDDWFTDFQQTGYATIPTGRLPVSSVPEADLIVSKIVNYEKGTFSGTWNSQALVVADQNVDIDFTSAAVAAASDLPTSLQVTQILANNLDFATARTQLLTALNNGALLVDYSGHGAEQQWSFSNLLNTDDASALTNGGRLPVYLVMDCLNGFFQDVYGESLAESLVLAPNGGAVAVWASSGFTNQPPQNSMNLSVLSQLALHPNEPLGQMLLSAKNGTTDNDVRRTWILFGDPAMKLQFAPSSKSGTKQTGIPPIGVNVPKDFSRNCSVSSECVRARQNNE